MNTIKPENHICICLLLATLLVITAGCIANKPQANSTQTPSAAIVTSSETPETTAHQVQANITPTLSATPSTTDTSSPQVPDTAVPLSINQGRFTDYGAMRVVRGEPLTITGSVPDKSMTTVQVWLFDRNVSTVLVPVNPNGTFSVTFDNGTTAALSRNFDPVIIAQYPAPPDRFAVNYDPASGQIVGSPIVPKTLLKEINNRQNYPSTRHNSLEQAINSPGTNNSCTLTYLYGEDAWIDITPIPTGPPGTMIVAGNTSLPAGTLLRIGVITASMHPTPKNYDSSHEIAVGSALVTEGTDGINHYSGTVNTSLLNMGGYLVEVNTGDEDLQADADIYYAEIVSSVSTKTCTKNEINWPALSLPPLKVNESLQPVLLEGELRLVTPGETSTQSNEVPYGTIIDCGPGGICRMFDESGVQFLAAYDSNEIHSMGVPNGAMVDSASGNPHVTVIILNGTVVLTQINECS